MVRGLRDRGSGKVDARAQKGWETLKGCGKGWRPGAGEEGAKGWCGRGLETVIWEQGPRLETIHGG